MEIMRIKMLKRNLSGNFSLLLRSDLGSMTAGNTKCRDCCYKLKPIIMKFVVISDTHGLHREMRLPAGDVIVHCGDFCNFGNREHAYDFLDWFRELDFEHKVFIAGNHDRIAADDEAQFWAWIPEGVTYLEDSGVVIEGINLWGSPVQPDLIGWAFGRRRGEAMRAHWDLIPPHTDVLITHTPPYGILDQSSSGQVLGCEVLQERLSSVCPKVHVFGHIHASYGKVQDRSTIYINASSINSQYELINPPVVFDLPTP